MIINRILYVSLICAVAFISYAAQISKKVKQAPPGTVHLKDNLYIDIAPITNLNYTEYYFWGKRNNFDYDCITAVASQLPEFGAVHAEIQNSLSATCGKNENDEKLIIDKVLPITWFNDSITDPAEHYYSNSLYRDHAAVNISYETAAKYCEWRSAMVMISYATLKNEKQRKRYYKKYSYRLPTEEEWEFAFKKFERELNAGQNTPDSKVRIGAAAVTKNGTSKYYLANIAEIVRDQGVAKGISWKDTLSNTAINLRQPYSKEADWLGFRCVCEIID